VDTDSVNVDAQLLDHDDELHDTLVALSAMLLVAQMFIDRLQALTGHPPPT
jgi:hypothetical protein